MNVVIIGNSAAGLSALQNFRKLDKTSRVVMISKEGLLPYSRVLLPYVLRGKLPYDGMTIRTQEFFSRMDAQCVEGTVTKLDTAARRVLLEDGRSFAYDKVLIATGSYAVTAAHRGRAPAGRGAHVDEGRRRRTPAALPKREASGGDRLRLCVAAGGVGGVLPRHEGHGDRADGPHHAQRAGRARRRGAGEGHRRQRRDAAHRHVDGKNRKTGGRLVPGVSEGQSARGGGLCDHGHRRAAQRRVPGGQRRDGDARHPGGRVYAHECARRVRGGRRGRRAHRLRRRAYDPRAVAHRRGEWAKPPRLPWRASPLPTRAV